MRPFLIVLRGTDKRQIPSSAIPLSAPLPTITAGGEHIALINPIWLDLSHTKTEGVSGSVDDPLNTITCSHGTHALIQPFLTRYNGGENRNHALSEPVPNIDCSNRYGLIEPLFIPQHGGGSVKPTSNPLSTIATTGSIGVVEPFLVAYYGNSFTSSVSDAMPTITTKDRFGLVEGQILKMPDGRQYKLDITHRMLTAKELAAATGFPQGYRFAGGDTAAKKQIGNAVCPALTSALYRAFLAA